MMELAAPAGGARGAPAFAAWLHEGLRVLGFRLPRWNRLTPGPLILLGLLLVQIAISAGVMRLYIDGAAQFQWRAAVSNWFAFVALGWACYVMRSRATVATSAQRAPTAMHLLGLVVASALWIELLGGAFYLALLRSKTLDSSGPAAAWLTWLLPTLWLALAHLRLLMRSGDKGARRRLLALLALVTANVVPYFETQTYFWTKATAAQSADADPVEPLRFTQELIENQAPLLGAKLGALAPQRPGVADMYTITFAPYEGEEVFRRESRMVSEVMAKRFDAAGRGVQLINHRDHLQDMPLATPLNLRRAIERIAATIDKEEDLLFIHLTSHGASDGELAVNFWPLNVDPVMPADLKKWLDASGIRHRVLSISACYAGNWIAPLAADDTLVMTASDADHTSYGCGKKSELTFFGRAMYDEQLRTQTRSFVQAHAAARKVIDKREKEAGKNDGYSNPQIKMGSRMGDYLDAMVRRLEKP